MPTTLLPLLFVPLFAGPFEDAPAVELRYTGALSRTARGADESPVKRFSLYCLVTREPAGGRRIAWFVGERGAGSLAWPERFGAVALDEALKPVAGAGARLLYEYEGNPIAVPLPLPVVAWGSLKAGTRWTEGKETWEVGRAQKIQERDCREVQASTSFGRKRTLWIDTDAPLVVALDERVFVGQGDEHLLTMQLESTRPLADDSLARDGRAFPALVKLQHDLHRAENETRPELSEEQLQLAAEALPQLQKDSADTPWSALVSAISKDVKNQLQRTDEISRLAEKFVGHAAPKFTLKLTDKTEVASESLKDKITVLHFWDYQGEPLVEPYGQVGYLEFLHNRRRKLGVQVYGIAVDARVADERTLPAALKSIQRLKGFMNLDYPIAVDDGKLLSRFGDPPKFGAKLPLWVVIDREGNVAHYHAGFYKINPDEGLRDLDELLIKLIRK